VGNAVKNNHRKLVSQIKIHSHIKWVIKFEIVFPDSGQTVDHCVLLHFSFNPFPSLQLSR